MRHLVRYGLITAWIAAGVLLVAGCGGDDDKGTGPSTLSTQAQFDTLSAHLNFEPGSGDDDIVSMMLDQLNTMYWDGIDEGDFASAGGVFASRFSPRASRAAVTDTSFSFSYDEDGGWWYIDYRESWTLLGFSYEGVYTDSVRFETEAGTPQIIPDEINTHRVIQHATIDVTILSASDSDSLGITSDFRINAAGLNSSTVTIDGDGSIGLGVYAVQNQSYVDMSVGMLANWNDVTVANPGESDVCPLSGSITGGFALDLDVQDGSDHFQASGDWGVDILFSGSGNTTVNVHTGDFEREFTGNVCTK